MMSNVLIAIIVEGNAEQAIVDVLLKHHALIYGREDLLQEEVIRTRSASSFSKKYLNKSMNKMVRIYRVLDSKTENFKLSKVYQKKVELPINNLYTTPEIEILFILYHDDINKYKRSKLKPSSFVKQNYSDLAKVKSYKDVFDFWDNHFLELIQALKKYKSSNSDNNALYDIINEDTKRKVSDK